jgi:hypothetical protein
MRGLTTIYFSAPEPGIAEPSEATRVVASPSAFINVQTITQQSATLPGTLVWNDWVYEDCRPAALIYCRMLYPRLRLSSAIAVPLYTSLVHNLRATLGKTDTSDSWGDMAGVLYWCALVGLAGPYAISPRVRPRGPRRR